MTEVTRVPLQPIKKGSLAKLWIAIAVLVAAAAALAWAALPKGLTVEELQAGVGPNPEIGQVIFAQYTGKLPDGTVFDQSQDFGLPPEILPAGTPFILEEDAMVPGFYQALQQVQKGGKYEIFIPADLAYGSSPPPQSPIPPDTDLTFEVEVIDILAREDVDRRFAVAQQYMQQQAAQAAGQGEEGATPAPAPAE